MKEKMKEKKEMDNMEAEQREETEEKGGRLWNYSPCSFFLRIFKACLKRLGQYHPPRPPHPPPQPSPYEGQMKFADEVAISEVAWSSGFIRFRRPPKPPPSTGGGGQIN